MISRGRTLAAGGLGGLALWISLDLYWAPRNDLREFNPVEVGRLETRMWRSYYDHKRLPLFLDLTTLLRTQYGMPFWRSNLAAYQAAKAAVVFQRGDYAAAVGPLNAYYRLILRSTSAKFRPDAAAGLELEWWIVHRERDRHPAGDLEAALANLQSELYGMPAEDFAEHGRARAEAMQIRDADGDWARIEVLLVQSWSSLHRRVSKKVTLP